MVEAQDETERVVEDFFGGGLFKIEFFAMLNGPEPTNTGPVEVVEEAIKIVVELGGAGEPGAVDDFASEPEEMVDMRVVPVVGGEILNNMNDDGENVGIGEVVVVV